MGLQDLLDHSSRIKLSRLWNRVHQRSRTRGWRRALHVWTARLALDPEGVDWILEPRRVRVHNLSLRNGRSLWRWVVGSVLQRPRLVDLETLRRRIRECAGKERWATGFDRMPDAIVEWAIEKGLVCEEGCFLVSPGLARYLPRNP